MLIIKILNIETLTGNEQKKTLFHQNQFYKPRRSLYRFQRGLYKRRRGLHKRRRNP